MHLASECASKADRAQDRVVVRSFRIGVQGDVGNTIGYGVFSFDSCRAESVQAVQRQSGCVGRDGQDVTSRVFQDLPGHAAQNHAGNCAFTAGRNDDQVRFQLFRRHENFVCDGRFFRPDDLFRLFNPEPREERRQRLSRVSAQVVQVIFLSFLAHAVGHRMAQGGRIEDGQHR